MAKSKARRNLIIVVLLFVLTGALILLAPTRPILPPESPEVGRLRISKTENAFFMLHDAATSLPQTGGMPETGGDFVRGPKAELLDVFLKEDAPEIAAAIEASRPAVEVVRKALAMPHLLVPIDWHTLDREPFRVNIYAPLNLTPRMFLVAVEDARLGRTDAAVATLVDFYRLRWRCTDELSVSPHLSPSLASRSTLLKQCPREFRLRLLPALVDLRSQWQPPEHALDERIRTSEASHKNNRAWQSTPLTWRIGAILQLVRYRPVIAANLQQMRKVATGGIKEYTDWEKHNHKLAEAAWGGDLGLYHLCLANSNYLLDLDGACTVIALELYKDDHGAYPESLDLLVPAYMPSLPTDPLSDKPLVYRREASDYVLYSVGRDGKDDGCPRYHSSDIPICMPPE